MDYFNFKTTAQGVNSIAACEFLSQRLRELANEFESRSMALKSARSNSFYIDDKAPALHIGQAMFTAWKSGACPATICRNLSARYMVNSQACNEVFERKRRAFERAEIKKRNQKIKKWDYDGISQAEICRRVGLSKGYVSKIINHYS